MSLTEETIHDWLADDALPLIVRELFADVSPAGDRGGAGRDGDAPARRRRRAHRAVRGRRRVRARRPAARWAPRGGEAPRAACLGALPRGHAGGPAPPGRRRLSQSAAAGGPGAVRARHGHRRVAARPRHRRGRARSGGAPRDGGDAGLADRALPAARRARRAARSPDARGTGRAVAGAPRAALRLRGDERGGGVDRPDRRRGDRRSGRRRLRRRSRRLARRARALRGRRGQRGLRLGQRPPRPRAGPGGRRRLRVHRELEPRRPGVPADAGGGAGVRGRLRGGARRAVHRGTSIAPPEHPSST